MNNIKVPELGIQEIQNQFTQSSVLPNRSLVAFNVGLYTSEIIKGDSLNEEKLENIKNSQGFKLIWLLNHLSKMHLNMNVCYQLLENINLEEEIAVEEFLNILLNQYFSDEIIVTSVNPELKISNNARLFSYIFNKPKNIGKQIEINESKILDTGRNKENNLKINHFEILIVDDQKTLLNNNKKCLICFEENIIENFFSIKTTNHEFCKSCLKDYVSQMIHSNQILKIQCPDECGKILKEDDIRGILEDSPDLYKKYIKFKNISILSQDPNIRWCVNSECEGYMRGNSKNNKLICGFCDRAMCFICRNEWHEGKNCEEAMNLEFKNYIARVEVKECPKCRTKIEKNDGCNHMTCTRCHYQFCWLCRRHYSNMHYKSYNIFGCPRSLHSKRKKQIFKSKLELCYYLFIGIFGFLIGIIILPLFLLFNGLMLNWVFLENNCCYRRKYNILII